MTSTGPSDHAAIINAYNEWDHMAGERKFSFCRCDLLRLLGPWVENTGLRQGGVRRRALELG